jgi:hypothetical protein
MLAGTWQTKRRYLVWKTEKAAKPTIMTIAYRSTCSLSYDIFS